MSGSQLNLSVLPQDDNPLYRAQLVAALQNARAVGGDGSADLVTATGTGTVARSLNARAAKLADVIDWITPAMVTANDYTAAVQAAVATGRPVRLPPYAIRITGPITCTTYGQVIEGYGRGVSVVNVDATFLTNFPTASGVFIATFGEPGPDFRDFAVIFAQPDTSTYSNLTLYPPAFYIFNCPRTRFVGMQVIAGIVGVDINGNCGGSYVIDVQLACFSKNINIDGSIDTVRIDQCHIYPFGTAGKLTANQTAIFYLPTCYGIYTGRCDDLKVTDTLFLCGCAVYSYGSPSGSTTGSMVGCSFDSYANVQISAGWLQVAGCYFTLGAGAVSALTISGSCEVEVSGNRFEIAGGSPTAGCVVQIGASAADPLIANISDNVFDNGSADVFAVSVIGTVANVTIESNNFRRAGSFANAMIYVQAGSNGVINGNNFSPNCVGPCMGFGFDAPYIVEGNYCGNHAILLPSQVATLQIRDNFAIGGGDVYDNNLVGVTRTVVLSSTTDGSGNFVLPHGITNLQLRLLRVTCLVRQTNGAAAPVNTITIDGTNISCNGLPATTRIRIVFDYTDWEDEWG